jgi:hypothetical protein
MSWVRCPSAAPIIKNSRQAIYLPDDLIESFFVGFGQRSCCRPEDEETLFRCDNSFLIGGNDITFQHVEHYFQRAVVAEDSLRGKLRSTVFTDGRCLFSRFLETLKTAPIC